MDERDHRAMNRQEPIIHDIETCDCFLCQSARAKDESWKLKERIVELEQSYAARLEAKCPHTLRRAVIDSLNECIGDLSAHLVEANKRIVQLEGALEDIATYATTETPEVVREIISEMLKALRLSI